MQLKLWLRNSLPLPAYRALELLAHLRPGHRRWANRQAEKARSRALLDEEVIRIVGSDYVQGGALEGTQLLRRSSWGLDYSSRLLGVYERELHPHIRALVTRTTPMIVDVGCADGYYVAGLGRLAPAATVVGYDIDPEALVVTRELSRVNGVEERVELRGTCRVQDLLGLTPGTLVVVDCEGGEADLITPDVASSNPATNFIIECHESIVPGITKRLIEIFDGRRSLVVRQEKRLPAEAPQLPPELAAEVLDELRSPMNQWLVIA